MLFYLIMTINAQEAAYTLTKENTYCENESVKAGELRMSPFVTFDNKATALDCAASVAATPQCSDAFFASGTQCACVRAGHTCKQESSETGFSLYSLNREVVLASPKYGTLGTYPGVGGVAGVPGAMPGAIPGANPMAYKTNYDCEREFDEITGINSIVDLPPQMTPLACQQAVMGMVQTQQCGGTWIFGTQGQCSCVRMNFICDEDSRPGFSIYHLQTPNTGAYRPGMPATPGYPARPVTQGYQRPGYPTTFQAGAYQAGAYPSTGTYQAGAYQAGAYQATAGYPATGFQGGIGYQAGYAGHRVLSNTAPCATLLEDACTLAANCQWNGEGCEILTEKTNVDLLANTRWILTVVVLPLIAIFVFAALFWVVIKAYRRGARKSIQEPILLESQERTIV